MSPWLEELLQRIAPGRVPAGDAVPHVSLHSDGVEVPAVVNGASRTLLHVGQAGSASFAFSPRALLVLRIVMGDGELRVDLPVEVVTCGRASMVLRALASPLVLRRRVVRDQALAEALTGGVVPATADVPASAAAPLVA